MYTKGTGSFDTEALFPLEGMEDTLTTDQVQSSEEGSDTDGSFKLSVYTNFTVRVTKLNNAVNIVLRFRSR